MARTVPNGYYTTPEPPGWCPTCEVETDSEHWTKNYNTRNKNGFSWLCRVRKAQRHAKDYLRHREERLESCAARYIKNPEYVRWKAYRHCDAKKYGGQTIEWEKAFVLMRSPCYFCTKPISGGLDRKDSNRGHAEDNVVACCAVCNNIISDLPWEAKECLKAGLEQMFITGAVGGLVACHYAE